MDGKVHLLLRSSIGGDGGGWVEYGLAAKTEAIARGSGGGVCVAVLELGLSW